MKLCYIANANSIHTQRWINPLIQDGADVHLLSYQPVLHPWPTLQNLVDLTQISNRPKLRFVVWARWIRNYVRELRPDILHAHQLQAAGWLAAIAGYHPFVASAWGSDILIEPHKSILRRLLIRYVLKTCDRLTVPSPLMYNAAVTLGVPQRKVRIIPWGIETAIFHPQSADRVETRRRFNIPLDSHLIFCPRGITPLYNIDILLHAFAQIRMQFPNMHLILLEFNVDATYRHALQEIIQQEMMQDHVHWLPPQKSAAEMARIYRAADITVSIPSSDGYGFSVYEAMACGCPTVVTDLPIFATELADGSHVLKVPVKSVLQTSRAMATLLQNDHVRCTLIRQGKKRADSHSVAQRIAQTHTLYKELIE